MQYAPIIYIVHTVASVLDTMREKICIIVQIKISACTVRRVQEQFSIVSVFVDRYGVLNLEICRHKTTSHECNRIDMTKQIEFMRWTHFCTTFDVREKEDKFESTVVTYMDGVEVARGN